MLIGSASQTRKNSARFGGVLAAGMLALVATTSQAAAGKIMFVLGGASIERGQTALAAQRGAQVEVGDTLVTARSGRMHLRMADGALISLKPDTRFTVEDYTVPEPEPADRDASASASGAQQATGSQDDLVGQARSGGGSAVLNLVRGGFRTITGLIGRRDKAAYQLKTPVATIGIRGTDFSVYQCTGNCNSDDGLYLGVWDGGITVQNDGGAAEFDAGEFGYVANQQTPPAPSRPNQNVTTDTPPPPQDDDEESDEGEDGESDQGGDQGNGGGDQGGDDQQQEGQDEQRERDDPPRNDPPPANDGAGDSFSEGGSESSAPETQPRPPQEVVDEPQEDNRPFRSVAYGTVGDGFVAAATTRNVAVDANGDLIAFIGAHPTNNGTSQGDYRIGSASAVNQGFDPSTSIRWGRWADGTATVAVNGGPTQNIDLSNRSLHYVFSDAVANAPAITLSGSAEFALVGNTNPTDTLGNVGVLGSASLFADFTNQTVESSIDLSINDQIWNAFGSGSIADGTNLFGGNYESVAVDGDTTGNTGNFSGFFAAPDVNGLPQGAGLIYNLSDGQVDVSGAAVFGDPTTPDETTPGQTPTGGQ